MPENAPSDLGCEYDVDGHEDDPDAERNGNHVRLREGYLYDDDNGKHWT